MDNWDVYWQAAVSLKVSSRFRGPSIRETKTFSLYLPGLLCMITNRLYALHFTQIETYSSVGVEV